MHTTEFGDDKRKITVHHDGDYGGIVIIVHAKYEYWPAIHAEDYTSPEHHIFKMPARLMFEYVADALRNIREQDILHQDYDAEKEARLLKRNEDATTAQLLAIHDRDLPPWYSSDEEYARW